MVRIVKSALLKSRNEIPTFTFRSANLINYLLTRKYQIHMVRLSPLCGLSVRYEPSIPMAC